MAEDIDYEALINVVRRYPCLWQASSKSYKDARARENAWKKVAEEVATSVDVCSKRWKYLRDKYVRELRKIKVRHSGDEGPPPSSSWYYFNIMSFVDVSVRHRPTHTNFTSRCSGQLITSIDDQGDEDNTNSTLLEDSPIDNPADSLSTTPAEDSHDTYDTYQVSRPPTPSSVSGQSLASALGTSQVSLKRKRQPEGTETSKKSKGQPDPVEAAIVESLKLVQSGHSKEQDDEDVHFGRQIAGTLRRFTYQQKAVAKLCIQQVMLDVEFSFTDGPLYSGN